MDADKEEKCAVHDERHTFLYVRQRDCQSRRRKLLARANILASVMRIE